MGVVGVALGGLAVCGLPGMISENETVFAIGGTIGLAGYLVLVLGFAMVGVPAMAASLLRAHEVAVFGTLFAAVLVLELRLIGVVIAFPVATAWSLFAYRSAFVRDSVDGRPTTV